MVLIREISRRRLLDGDARQLVRQRQPARVLEAVVGLVRGEFVRANDSRDDVGAGLVARDHLLDHLGASPRSSRSLRGGRRVNLPGFVQTRLLAKLLRLGLGLLRLHRCLLRVSLRALHRSLEVIQLPVQTRLLVPSLLLRLLLIVHVALVQLGNLQLQLLNLRVRLLHRGHDVALLLREVVHQLLLRGGVRPDRGEPRGFRPGILPARRRGAQILTNLLAGRGRTAGQGRVGGVVGP